MSATYLNISAGTVYLEKTSYSRTSEGLERIQETYNCLTSDVPNHMTTYANSTTHGTYTNMVIESTDFSSAGAGLSKITVNYVGLLGSTLPAPIITIEPSEAPGPNGVLVKIKYISEVSDLETIRSNLELPSSPFRGVSFYQSVAAPYVIDPEPPGFITESITQTRVEYKGMLRKSCFIEKYGKYALVIMTYEDVLYLSDVQISPGNYVTGGPLTANYN